MKEDSLELAKLEMRIAAALAEAIHSNRTLIFADSSRVIREPTKRSRTKPNSSSTSQSNSNSHTAANATNTSFDDQLTPQQIVKILMRKCSLYHYSTHKSFYSRDEPGVARLRYHHSCWFQPISNCLSEQHIEAADWRALEARPNSHANRVKYSDLYAAQASLWVPPSSIRDESLSDSSSAHSQPMMSVVERWSAELVGFVMRPVALLEKHLASYVHRVSSEFIEFQKGVNHIHLAGISMRHPPLAPGAKAMTPTQHWRQHLKILEQLLDQQEKIPREDRFIYTRQIWISTWEKKQHDLIESWHEKAKLDHPQLKDRHIILSQHRDVEGQHHEEDIVLDLPDFLEFAMVPEDSATYGATDSDARAILDRLNLQALHSLEDLIILGYSTYFIASLAHPHSVLLHCVRNLHNYSTPPIWLNVGQSADSFFPVATGFEQDEGTAKSSSGRLLTNLERWSRAVTALVGPPTMEQSEKPLRARLSPETALPDIPVETIDRNMRLWNSPVEPYAEPMVEHDEL